MRTSATDGFSLIEVLVSILVLTIGVIGAASMQMTALQSARWSAFQTTALHLALEMAEHIRGYTHQVRAGDVSNPYLAIDHRELDAQVKVASASNCYGQDATCNAEQLASFEIALWLQRAGIELPGARVRVCRDAQPWDAGGQRYTWHCTESSDKNVSALIFIKIGWPAQDVDKDFPPVLVLPVAAY